MADARLRRLEHDPPSQTGLARLLRERQRSGQLDLEALWLRAYVGDPAAIQALGAQPEVPAALEAWARGLQRWGPSTQAGAALAVASEVLPLWEAWEPGEFGPRDRLRRALEQTGGWVAGSARRQAAEVSLEEAAGVVEAASHLLAVIDAEHRGVVKPATWRAVETGWLVVAAVRAAHVHLDRRSPVRGRRPRDVGQVASEAARIVGEGRVRAAIQRALT